MTMTMENLLALASGFADELTGLRRAIHARPELSWQETETSILIEDLLRGVAGEIFGSENIREMPVIMGSEDFSFYGEKAPAVFGMLGMGDASKGSDRPHHSPHFDANDGVLSSGSALLAGFALRFLSRG